MTAQADELPPQVLPQPVPLAFTAALVQGPAGKFVRIQLFHAMGETVMFLDPETALSFTGQIRALAKQANHALILPPGLVVPT